MAEEVLVRKITNPCCGYREYRKIFGVYHPEEDDRVKTVEQLTDLYYRSVGHNATLLLNFPIDRNGLVHPIDSANAVNFYKNIQNELTNNLLAGITPTVSDERGGAYKAKAMTDGNYDTYWATNDGVIPGHHRRFPRLPHYQQCGSILCG